MNSSSMNDVTMQELEESTKRLLAVETYNKEAEGAENAVTSRSAFAYAAIPETAPIIRIFTLHPGSGDEALRGTLGFAAINTDQSFEALSYCWGASTTPDQILLGDKHFLPITSSLKSALKRLRFATKPRRLWIDAVCINQANLSEKSAQVRRMSSVYSSAVRVLCWLGEDNEARQGAQAMQLLNDIGNADLSSLKSLAASPLINRLPGLPDNKSEAWKSLIFLFTRPWFLRCWVVQEFVLAQEAIVICGDAEIDWRDISYGNFKAVRCSLINWGTYAQISPAKAQAMRASYALLHMTKIRSELNPDELAAQITQSLYCGDKTLDELEAEYQQHELMSYHIAGIRLMTTTIDPQLVSESHRSYLSMQRQGAFKLWRAGQSPVQHSLAGIMTVFRPLDSSDPRDKVYSLTGITQERSNPSLLPSYGSTVEEVYVQMARALLVRGGKDAAMLLIAAQLETSAAHSEGRLPSWVPDWRLPCLETCGLGNCAAIDPPIYLAGGRADPHVRLSDTLTEAYLGGWILDAVQGVVHFPQYHKGYDRNDLNVFYSDENGKFSFESLIRAIEDQAHPEKGGVDMLWDMHKFFHDVDELVSNDSETGRDATATTNPVWRTLLANMCSQNPQHEALFEQSYHAFRAWLAEQPASMSEVPDEVRKDPLPFFAGHGPWNQMFHSTVHSYSFCRTTQGRIGMVPRRTRAGDGIAVLVGCRLPFVLRATGEGGSRHELIGAGYVHGISIGEALDMPEWNETEICLV